MAATRFPVTMPWPIPGTISQQFPAAYICPDKKRVFNVNEIEGHARLEYPVYASKEDYEAGAPPIDSVRIDVPSGPLPDRSKDGTELVKGDAEKFVAGSDSVKQDPTKFYDADGNEKAVWFPAYPGFAAISAALAKVMVPFKLGVDQFILQRGEFATANDA